tara:strand:- start:304 stop:447 length:144 start_codon:yes stop_codon:yes gene_type:complete
MNSSVYLMIIALGLFFAGVVSEQVWLMGLGFIGGLGTFFYAKFFGGY